MAKALASGKSAKKASAKKKAAKPWNASWAACGDGCLDKLVVSVKKEPPTTRPLRGGLVEFPADPAASSAGRSSAGGSGGSGGRGALALALTPTLALALALALTLTLTLILIRRATRAARAARPAVGQPDAPRDAALHVDAGAALPPNPHPQPQPHPHPHPHPNPSPSPSHNRHPNPNPKPNPNQVPRFHESVRLLFVVGSNAPGPAVADELRVNVTEGERMRAFCPPGRTCAQKKFDPNKRVQTGSVTTYWKLAALRTGPNPNPNPGPNTDPNRNPGPNPNPNPGPNLSPNPNRNPNPNPDPNPSPIPNPISQRISLYLPVPPCISLYLQEARGLPQLRRHAAGADDRARSE